MKCPKCGVKLQEGFLERDPKTDRTYMVYRRHGEFFYCYNCKSKLQYREDKNR